jgi:putative SOS response-associated peptidase YedK
MPNEGKPIAIAVICEKWTNGEENLDTFIQVTTPANLLISKITDRMPAILRGKCGSENVKAVRKT